MAPRSFVWVDVFGDRPFTANPLAVFPDATGMSDEEMAAVARELNLSETTFVTAPTDGVSTHRVRIFTATRELPFAGHPTVGTAVALATLADADAADYRFQLAAGVCPVTVRRRADGVAEASFVAPRLPEVGAAPVGPEEVAALAGLNVDDLDPEVPVHLADAGGTVFLVAVLRSLEALGRARPVGAHPGVVGLYLTTPAADGWQCRMFAPEAGMVEDPATGSAACAFAATLQHHVSPAADGTHQVTIRQGVEMGRPSTLHLAYDVAADAISEVRLRGAAVPVLRGELSVTLSEGASSA